MKWINVNDALPEHNQAVLVRRIQDNWHKEHTLADGSEHTVWRWQAAWFERGRTTQEVKDSGIRRRSDQADNNHTPYSWVEFGPGHLFGQDVSHWCAITDPTR